MADFRKAIRSLGNKLYSVRGLANGRLARLEEINNGHDMVPFVDLPPQAAFSLSAPDLTDVTDVEGSDTENTLISSDARHGDDEASSGSSENDVDSDDRILAKGGIKD
ncbi:hypothetical protein BJX76DRAFT_356938 [Aspergillus varians]